MASNKKMDVDEFFELLLEELNQNQELKGYYRFLDDESKFAFRKAYFVQRLKYISEHVTDKSSTIWDCGSGYGTTCIYLAINGFRSFGSTLEYYYKEIPNREKYWSKYGDMSLMSSEYADIYDSHPKENSVDIIILQDTLHHLEPLQDALAIFKKVLKPGGKIILIEENGSNIIQNIKLFKQRGNKRVIKYYDEKLGKEIIMGNENIRSHEKWKAEFEKQNFRILESETEYIRYFLPPKFKKSDMNDLIKQEQKIAIKNQFLKKYFFFGINYIIEKV